MNDVNVGQLAIELSHLHHLAESVLPGLAEEFGQANTLVHRERGTDETAFQHGDGRISVVAAPLAELTARLQDALAANHDRLHETADALNRILAAYRRTDDLSADQLAELNARLDGTGGFDSQIDETARNGGITAPDEDHSPIRSDPDEVGTGDLPTEYTPPPLRSLGPV